jgi:hypothetical protein
MKTVIYSLASNFVDFALSAVTCQVKKLDANVAPVIKASLVRIALVGCFGEFAL